MEVTTENNSNATAVKSSLEMANGKERNALQKAEAEISLHPLVIMNISEHWTRLRSQNVERKPVQVYGAVLGKQIGRHIELINSFEIKLNEAEGGLSLDEEFFVTREGQYKEVFPDLDLMGWYTTGVDAPTDSDLYIHKQIIKIRETPVMVKLDPQSSNSDKVLFTLFHSAYILFFKLPIAVFESLVNPSDETSMQWQRIPWALASEQAERIGIDHIAKISTTTKNSKSQTSSQVAGQYSAVNMLQTRLQLILDYVVAIQKGELPRNEAIIREIALLVRRLPVLDFNRFDEDFKNQCIEAKLTLHVLSMAKICGILNSGLFGVQLLTDQFGFSALNKVVAERCNKIVDSVSLYPLILNPTGTSKTVKLFDDLSNEICCAADLTECVRCLHPGTEYTSAAEKSMHEYTLLVESYNTNAKLYEALKNSLETQREQLNEVDIRTIQLFLKDFEQSGIHLPYDKKSQFVKISGSIFDTGSKFIAEAEKPVCVNLLERRKYGSGSYLTGPTTSTLSTASRKWSYATYYRHSALQESLLRQLISCRHRLAELTGFKTYAHRAQMFSILGSYDRAHEFITSIIKACRPSAERELTVLMDVLTQCDPDATKIGEWDLQFLCSVYRRKVFGSLYNLREFFTLRNLMKGLESVTDKWYGLKFVLSRPEEGEIWPGNVFKLDVQSSDSKSMGTIYLDVQDRSNKSMGPCHFTVRCSKLLDDKTYQLPIVVVSVPFASEFQELDQIQLNPHQAENFFHEMGHAFHSILGKTEYQHVAGTRCPTDMAEIPSNLMEYFFNDINVLQKMAFDGNGNAISVEDAASMIASRFAFTSIDLLQQAVYSLFDLEIHGENAEGIISGKFTTTDLFTSIWKNVFPEVELAPNSAYHHRFTHLVPYGAKYYSYLVARAAASLIWNLRFRDDPFSSESGQNWAKVQSFGGSLPSMNLLQMSLGYIPTNHTLADAVCDEAKCSCQGTGVSL
uniref:COP9 signalosome complex subunit 6 n=1 Tax=Syphacia muris TaxID=451379 RepID=A0A0N5ATK6_9BILA